MYITRVCLTFLSGGSRGLDHSVAFVFENVSSDTFPPLTWPLLRGKAKGGLIRRRRTGFWRVE